MREIDTAAEAMRLREKVEQSATKARRLKARSLMRRFGYVKRSDSNAAMITEALGEVGVKVSPPIVRLGDDWQTSLDDWVYLTLRGEDGAGSATDPSQLPSAWNADGWFDRIAEMQLRTEKEVEIKFIVPLLARLGYADADRYDGMPIPAAMGRRKTTLVVDFACFNSAVEALRGQPLLTVEAKREHRLQKAKELAGAHNQAKSYCLWAQCDYFMITDSQTVEAFHVARGGLNHLDPLFSASRQDLKSKFGDLYAVLSKEVLTRRYLQQMSTTDEAD